MVEKKNQKMQETKMKKEWLTEITRIIDGKNQNVVKIEEQNQ